MTLAATNVTTEFVEVQFRFHAGFYEGFVVDRNTYEKLKLAAISQTWWAFTDKFGHEISVNFDTVSIIILMGKHNDLEKRREGERVQAVSYAKKVFGLAS